MEQKNDEIDLLELFKMFSNSVKKFINWLLELIKQFIILLIRKSVWIISFGIIGAGIGIWIFYSTERYYSSEMTAKSNATNNEIAINSINLLNDLCATGNYEMLAKYLETSQESAQKVKSIQAFYGIDINRDGNTDYIDYENTYNAQDTTQKRLGTFFYVKVEVLDENIFSVVTAGTRKYLFSNPYIEENNKIRKQQALDMINSYNQEIKKLDSLQKTYYFQELSQKTQNSQMVFLNEKDVKLFHGEILGLVRARQQLEKSLAIDPEPVTVIQDFTPLSKAENPLSKYFIRTGLFFAFLGFIIGLLWQYRRELFSLVKKF